MSNYATPGGLLSMAIVLPIVGLGAIALRFYTRHLKKAPLLLDDWLIIPAEFLLIIMCILTIIGVHGHGFGYKIPGETTEKALNTDPYVEVLNNKMEYAIYPVQCLQIGFTKLSILFFYRRIFCSTSMLNFMNFATWILVLCTIVWSISFFFANIFECGTNFAANWSSSATLTATCINLTQFNEAYMFSDFIIDFFIFFLPMYKIWKLHMPITRKVAVMIILALGAMAVVASAIKVAIIVEIESVVRSGFTSKDTLLSTDPDILGSIIIYWTILESGLAVIVACLPTLRSLLSDSPNILRSLRSMLSVASLRSNGNRSPKRSCDIIPSSGSHSTSPQTQISKLEILESGMGPNAYTMKDLDTDVKGGVTHVITETGHVTQDGAEHD